MINYKKTKKQISSFVFLLILISYAVIQVYPFIWLVFSSLKTNSELFGENIMGIPHNFIWENYEDAFFGGQVGLYLFNSTLVTVLSKKERS